MRQLISGGVNDKMGGALFVDDIYTEIYVREWSALNRLARTCKAAAVRMTPAIMARWVMHDSPRLVSGGFRSVDHLPNGVRHGTALYELINCTVTAEYNRGELTRVMTSECGGATTRLAVKGAAKYLRAVRHGGQVETTIWPGGGCKLIDAHDKIILDDVLKQYSPAGNMGDVLVSVLATAGAYRIIGDVLMRDV